MLGFGLLIAVGLLVLMLRSWLIVLGLYKEPILNTFEVYGDERIYSPMFRLVLWTVVFVWFSLILLAGFDAVGLLTLILLLPLTSVYQRIVPLIRNNPGLFMRFPAWYYWLIEHTTREERRRIAYLWLRLPLRTRLLYNARDEYFRQWVDLVLMTIA